MIVSQVKNMQTLPYPTFLEPYKCNRSTVDSHTPPPPPFPFFLLPSAETMAKHKSVMKDDILCELYADTYSDV